jgi:citrate lyase beta subunit
MNEIPGAAGTLPARRRRSCLVTPGSAPRKIEKAAGSAADEVVIDLEDSVSADLKHEARDNAVRALAECDWSGKAVAIRINQVAGPWWEADIRHIFGRAARLPDTIVIPKLEAATELSSVSGLVATAMAGRPDSPAPGLQVLIESARGLLLLQSLPIDGHRIETAIFGPLDMARSFGLAMPGGSFPNPALEAQILGRIAIWAKAAGAQALDGPYVAIDDLAGLRASATAARNYGYSGKWAIHPGQVGILNDVFNPTSAELDWARSVSEAYRRALEDGAGVLRLGGDTMVDEATYRIAEQILAATTD